MSAEVERPGSVWDARFVWVTAGAVALIFLAATQSLAVTTVMPVVSDDLDGAALYAIAFAGTLATSVIGMVAVGAWSDRSGPVWPLTVSVALFVTGLVVVGTRSHDGGPRHRAPRAGPRHRRADRRAVRRRGARLPARAARPRVRRVLGRVGDPLARRPLPGGGGDRVPALAVGLPRRRGAHRRRLHHGRDQALGNPARDRASVVRIASALVSRAPSRSRSERWR